MEKKILNRILAILSDEYIKFKEPIVSRIVNENGGPFRILISTMISLRTKDDVTEKVSRRLFSIADNPESILKIDEKKLEKILYPAGFYRNKAKAIKETCSILINRFNSRVPDTLDELLSLPGVGRKTANLVLSLGYGKYAICVDTHVHRISNRLGVVETKNPEETEFALMDVLPKKWWIKYNDMLVTWGQNICHPVSPRCSECAICKYCPKIGVKKSR